MESAPLLVTRDDNDAVAAAAGTAVPSLAVAPAAPAPAATASRPVRRRGHRAQSAVWRYLTADANPHHAVSSQCMHCQHLVPHHRKNEKARAHLKRCAAFRKKMAELPSEERPAWVDLNVRIRGNSNQQTSKASTRSGSHGTGSVGASLPYSPSPVAMDASSLGTVVSDVEMLDESLTTPMQPTPAGVTANDGDGRAHDGDVGHVKRGENEASDHDQLAEQESLMIDSNTRSDAAHTYRGIGIQSVQDAVAMHVYMTGVPIESVVDASFVTAFRLANSSVALPNLDELRGVLLDRAYQRVLAKVDADMRLSAYNAVSSNSWWADDNRSGSERLESTSKPMREAKYMAVNEAQTFYMGASHAPHAEWRDPEFLSSEVVRIIEHCQQRISGVVTDCTPAHQAAWQKLKTIYPGKFFQGCVSHGLRLFIQDIFGSSASSTASLPSTMASTGIVLSGKTVNNVAASIAGGVDSANPLVRLQVLTKNCRLIVDCFNRDDALRAKLQQALDTEGRCLEFPPENRQWDRLQAGFRSVLSAVPALRTLVVDPSFVNNAPLYFHTFRAHIMQTVLDPEFVALLEKALALLKPLRAALSHFEQQDVPCSEVFSCFAKKLPAAFTNLLSLFTEDERGHLLVLNQRHFSSLYGDGHGVAYLLDPRYIGDGLSVEVRKNLEDFIYAFPTVSDDGTSEAMDENAREEAQLEMAQQLTEFIIDATRERTNQTFRFSMLARNKKSVLQYWLTDGQRWPRLQRLACRVFCLPSSTLRLDRLVASLAAAIGSSRATASDAAADTAASTRATRVEDKIQSIRINTLLLGDDKSGGVTC